MSGWGSYSSLWGPLVAFGTVGVFILILRWAFSRGSSLVQRRPGTGSESEYGMLVPVAAPATFVEAEMLRQRLVEHNIRATLAPTTDGPRVMVFPDELRAAQAVLRS